MKYQTVKKNRAILLLMLSLFSILSCENSNYRFKRISKEDKVAIQPFGDFDQLILEEVRDSLESTFGRTVHILPNIDYPKKAFINVKSPRYRADTLIAYLRDTKPDSIDYIIGIGSKDVSCTKYKDDSRKEIKSPEWKYKDWGVFGLGYVPGPSCMVSTFRLKKGVSKKKYIERLRKVVKHELGHNLGLHHCQIKNV